MKTDFLGLKKGQGMVKGLVALMLVISLLVAPATTSANQVDGQATAAKSSKAKKKRLKAKKAKCSKKKAFKSRKSKCKKRAVKKPRRTKTNKVLPTTTPSGSSLPTPDIDLSFLNKSSGSKDNVGSGSPAGSPNIDDPSGSESGSGGSNSIGSSEIQLTSGLVGKLNLLVVLTPPLPDGIDPPQPPGPGL